MHVLGLRKNAWWSISWSGSSIPNIIVANPINPYYIVFTGFGERLHMSELSKLGWTPGVCMYAYARTHASVYTHTIAIGCIIRSRCCMQAHVQSRGQGCPWPTSKWHPVGVLRKGSRSSGSVYIASQGPMHAIQLSSWSMLTISCLPFSERHSWFWNDSGILYGVYRMPHTRQSGPWSAHRCCQPAQDLIILRFESRMG